jgi:hypothetical protein
MRPKLSQVFICVITCAFAGCSSPPKAPVATRNARLKNLSYSDTSALQAGQYRIPSGAIILIEKIHYRPSVALALSEHGFGADVAVLRNPGAYVIIVTTRENRSIGMQDKPVIVALARSYGATVTNRIPMRLGPDKKTPLVMKNVIEFAPEQYNRPTQLTTVLEFPDVKTLRQASAYIDPNSYKLQIVGKQLKATCTAPEGAATDEWGAFEPIARKFGGEVCYVEGGSQVVPERNTLGAG